MPDASRYPGGKVFDCFDTLFREAEKIDVGWHMIPPSRKSDWGRRLY